MPADTINSDLQLRGLVDMANASAVQYKPASIFNAAISATAAIAASKLQHRHKAGTNFGIEEDAAPSTGTTYSFIVFRASAACTVNAFRALMTDTGSQTNANDFAFDLKRATAGSGSFASILSATVDIDSDSTDNTAATGTLSATTLAAGDVLLIEVTTPATITGAHGMYAEVEIDEAAS